MCIAEYLRVRDQEVRKTTTEFIRANYVGVFIGFETYIYFEEHKRRHYDFDLADAMSLLNLST
jgi:hypothetical protein